MTSDVIAFGFCYVLVVKPSIWWRIRPVPTPAAANAFALLSVVESPLTHRSLEARLGFKKPDTLAAVYQTDVRVSDTWD